MGGIDLFQERTNAETKKGTGGPVPFMKNVDIIGVYGIQAGNFLTRSRPCWA